MSLTLQIPPELEADILKAAAREGVPLETFVVAALEERVRREAGDRAPETEAALLAEIGAGLPPATWERYHALCAKRRRDSISDGEYAELLGLTETVEQWNVLRLELLSRLAEIRGLPLRKLMEGMGLGQPPYA